MKKFFSIISIVLIMFFILGFLTGCSNKNDENNSANAQGTVYSWPDLTNYDIPNLEKGKITKLTELEGIDGYIFNYKMELTSITKEDIEEFCKSFENWTVAEDNSKYILIKTDSANQVSVIINFDEENSTAEIVMTAM